MILCAINSTRLTPPSLFWLGLHCLLLSLLYFVFFFFFLHLLAHHHHHRLHHNHRHFLHPFSCYRVINSRRCRHLHSHYHQAPLQCHHHFLHVSNQWPPLYSFVLMIHLISLSWTHLDPPWPYQPHLLSIPSHWPSLWPLLMIWAPSPPDPTLPLSFSWPRQRSITRLYVLRSLVKHNLSFVLQLNMFLEDRDKNSSNDVFLARPSSFKQNFRVHHPHYFNIPTTFKLPPPSQSHHPTPTCTLYHHPPPIQLPPPPVISILPPTTLCHHPPLPYHHPHQSTLPPTPATPARVTPPACSLTDDWGGNQWLFTPPHNLYLRCVDCVYLLLHQSSLLPQSCISLSISLPSSLSCFYFFFPDIYILWLIFWGYSFVHFVLPQLPWLFHY